MQNGEPQLALCLMRPVLPEGVCHGVRAGDHHGLPSAGFGDFGNQGGNGVALGNSASGLGPGFGKRGQGGRQDVRSLCPDSANVRLFAEFPQGAGQIQHGQLINHVHQ